MHGRAIEESASRDYVATHNRTYSDISAKIGNSLFMPISQELYNKSGIITNNDIAIEVSALIVTTSDNRK